MFSSKLSLKGFNRPRTGRFLDIEDAPAEFVKKLGVGNMPVMTEVLKLKRLELARH